jgi:hypothetical protein
MLRQSQTRLIGSLLAVCYLVAACAGGLFHQHAPGECAGHGCTAHADHCDGEHEHHADHVAETSSADSHSQHLADDDGTSGHRLPDDGCAVCRFLGLSSLPVTVPVLVASCDLIAAAHVAEPRHESRPLALTLHSRAPPALPVSSLLA